MVAFPDIRQAGENDCGVACLRAALAHFGLKGDGAEALLGAGLERGASPQVLVQAARRLGLGAWTWRGMTVMALATEAAEGNVVLCPIQEGDPEREESGHWVCVLGVALGGVLLHDPDQGQLYMPAEEFRKRWHDTDAEGRAWKYLGIILEKRQ